MRNLAFLQRGRVVAFVILLVAAWASGACWLIAHAPPDAGFLGASGNEEQDGSPGDAMSISEELKIDLARLSDAGLMVQEPDEGYRPLVDRRAAEVAVGVAEADILGSALARVDVPGFEGHAWLVSLEAGAIGLPGPEQVVRSLVAFVDAETGEPVLVHASSDGLVDGSRGYFPTPLPILDDIPEWREAFP